MEKKVLSSHSLWQTAAAATTQGAQSKTEIIATW